MATATITARCKFSGNAIYAIYSINIFKSPCSPVNIPICQKPLVRLFQHLVPSPPPLRILKIQTHTNGLVGPTSVHSVLSLPQTQLCCYDCSHECHSLSLPQSVDHGPLTGYWMTSRHDRFGQAPCKAQPSTPCVLHVLPCQLQWRRSLTTKRSTKACPRCLRKASVHLAP